VLEVMRGVNVGLLMVILKDLFHADVTNSLIECTPTRHA